MKVFSLLPNTDSATPMIRFKIIADRFGYKKPFDLTDEGRHLRGEQGSRSAARRKEKSFWPITL
jgi:hypothetical protein